MTDRCEQIEPMLSAYLDGELDADERAAVERHVADCPACAAELRELRGVVGVADELAAPSVDDAVWDAFLGNVYNRLERRLGWMMLIIGAVMVAGLIVYEAVVLPWAPPTVKVLCAVPIAGLGLLFVSVLRQRLHVARSDRYSRDIRH